MARGVRLKFNREALEQLDKSPAMLAFISGKVESIASACNSQSSWGGYYFNASIQSDRARGTVWSADDRNDEARDQRLVRNMDR